MSGAHRSLRERVLKAGSVTMAGYAFGQLLRFGSNLILTRLLFPEAFGIVAIMQAVVLGVTMLSDVGISQSIVRSKRGGEADFVNTAWTVQICKGLLMATALFLLRWPISAAYNQPLLADMMLVAALASVIGGFNSTKVALADRNVDAIRVTLIETGSLAVGICAMIVLAWLDPTPWALVWGNLVGTVVRMLAGHLVLKGPTNRLAWDKSVARGIFSFGGWVLLSSALTFLSGEGNRLILGALLDVRLLGLLGLSSTLNLVVWQAVRQMSSRVLFPAYSEVLRSDPKRLNAVVQKARLVQIAPAWTVSLVLALLGPQIIRLLYDPRYADAGIILQVQATSLMVTMLIGSYAGVLWAMGKVRLSTAMLAVQIGLQVCGMLIGHWFHGKPGVIIGFAGAVWVLYPIHAIVYGRLGLWQPRIDIPVLLASASTAVAVALTADWDVLRGWQ
jgi:O-antigen/teichoic acid export membrane protein